MARLIDDTKKHSAQKVIQTQIIIADMMEQGKPVNYYTVAEAAKVSRPFLYAHNELRELIEACRVSGMTKAALQQEVTRLRLKIRALEQRLE